MLHFPPPVILLEVLAIDISLAGDNAIAVGLAASGLPTLQRHKAVVSGILAAACLRILFALFAVRLLHFTGLLAAGGFVLLWVCWKMYREIRKSEQRAALNAGEAPKNLPKKLSQAIMQIVLADFTMSLDNVLAVAGAARNHVNALVVGLAISVVLMGMAASVVARLMSRHSWLSWVGLLVVLYTSLRMIYEGSLEIYAATIA